MVGVARLPIGQDDDLGFEAADDAHEGSCAGPGWLSRRASGMRKILTKGQAQDGSGLAGLGETQLGRAARAHFAGGQVEGAGEVAGFGHLDESAAAGLLECRRDGRRWPADRARGAGGEVEIGG